MRPAPIALLDDKALRAAWDRVIPLQRRIYGDDSTKASRRARYGEMVAALEAMHSATGDARFVAAVEAMKEHGFDRQDAGTWKRRFDSTEKVCVRRMHELLSRNRARNARHAAGMVAVMFSIDGASFDAVRKRLERAYRRAKPILTTRIIHSDVFSKVWTKDAAPKIPA
jgi:hypothetical protein